MAGGSICRQWSPGLGTLVPSSSCLFMRFDLGSSHCLPLSRNAFQRPGQSLGYLGGGARFTSLRKLPLATLVLGLLSSLNSHGTPLCFPVGAPDCVMYGGGLSIIAGSLLRTGLPRISPQGFTGTRLYPCAGSMLSHVKPANN